jgi:hypothetical protein
VVIVRFRSGRQRNFRNRSMDAPVNAACSARAVGLGFVLGSVIIGFLDRARG